MTATHKGVVFLNQYNIKSLMKLSEVKKFCDGTLVKIQENLIDMLTKNKLGSGNKRLKGRDWTNYDVKSLKEMLKKIDEILRHREQLRRLEEYVRGHPKTINPCMFKSESRVDCYYNAGFETDRDDIKSQTGYVFVLNGGAVDSKSSKQSTIAMSATEAEYIAASEAAMEAIWIRKFISGLGIIPTINEPIKMFCDNSTALLIANEPGVQRGARHYHKRYHYVRECIVLGEINLLKVYTDDNLADPFTKALPKGKNCSGGLSSINTRRDNSMHFARQDSRSQGFFMRPVSAEKDSIDQSNGSFRSTRSHKQASSELVTPLFSQPASINSNVPKVRNIHYVGDYDLPSLQPPKFSRTTTEKVVPMECRPDNNKHTTKHIGLEKKRSPRIEVAESRGKYLLQIELPGISISDIRVEVHNTTLTVQTTKGRTTAYSLSDHTSSSYYKRDVLEEPFEITWPLPFDVNPDSVSAEFLDGLLCITITKLRVPVW
ncbi:retrotransposon protein, putative, ty1-copia subclass [Tanacetum coccineum]